MNVSKKEFKKAYSDYRKKVSLAHSKGLEAYREAINTDLFLREIKLHIAIPVSLKVWYLKNRKGIK